MPLRSDTEVGDDEQRNVLFFRSILFAVLVSGTATILFWCIRDFAVAGQGHESRSLMPKFERLIPLLVYEDVPAAPDFLGVMSIGLAFRLWLLRSPFKAAAWPLIVIGVIELGVSLYVRS